MQACYSRCQLASQACMGIMQADVQLALSQQLCSMSLAMARWQPPAEQTAARPHAGCQAC